MKAEEFSENPLKCLEGQIDSERLELMGCDWMVATVGADNCPGAAGSGEIYGTCAAGSSLSAFQETQVVVVEFSFIGEARV